jgi:glutathione S-transferase
MIIYYDWNRSPSCFKTKILLNELGIAYEQRNVDHEAMQSPEFFSRFPARQTPALQDGDLFLSESGAIALHLSEKFGGPIPKDADRRALMHCALFFEASMLNAVVGGRGYFGEAFKPPGTRDEKRLALLAEESQGVAAMLGQMLGDREYFAAEFSLADIQLYAGTTKALEVGLFRDPPRNLVAWNQKVGTRPSVIAARPEYLPYRVKQP